MSKYEYFKPFVATDAKAFWEAYTSPRMDYFCTDMPGVDFNAGFLVAIKPGYMDIPHIHDGAENYFVFTGADLTDVFHAKFVVDMFLGDSPSSMERYTLTKPCIVRVPAGVWHCPVFYKEIDRGINTMMWYSGISTGRVYPKVDADGKESVVYEKDNWVRPCKLDETKNCTYCGRCFTQSEEHIKNFMTPFYAKEAKTRKYADCIVELTAESHSLGDAIVSPRALWKGFAGTTVPQKQFSINIIKKPCVLGDPEPVSNGRAVEFLWFSGADAVDPWNSFDAEIELMAGDDPQTMEKIVIDRPGVVALPAGSWKSQIIVKRASKPLCFIPWYQSMQDRYKVTRKSLNGKDYCIYQDIESISEPTAGDELYLQIKR